MASPRPRGVLGEDLVWYFAYGSNLSREKFVGGRGIIPLKSARVRTPQWMLALNIPGLPYQEPTFTSVVPQTADPRWPNAVSTSCREEKIRPGSVSSGRPCSNPLETRDEPRDAVGLAYLITAAQYRQVIASEGGGSAYEDVEIRAEPLEESDRERAGGAVIQVRTLASAIQRSPWPKPSKRYMDIILTGAHEAKLPADYQTYLRCIDTYHPPEGRRGKVGARIFLSIWGPVLGLMEKITNATIGADGYAPYFVILLVRAVMFMIWFTHDVFFAPIFGRGDGNESAGNLEKHSHTVVDEKSPLLGEYRKGPENV